MNRELVMLHRTSRCARPPHPVALGEYAVKTAQFSMTTEIMAHD